MELGLSDSWKSAGPQLEVLDPIFTQLCPLCCSIEPPLNSVIPSYAWLCKPYKRIDNKTSKMAPQVKGACHRPAPESDSQGARGMRTIL